MCWCVCVSVLLEPNQTNQTADKSSCPLGVAHPPNGIEHSMGGCQACVWEADASARAKHHSLTLSALQQPLQHFKKQLLTAEGRREGRAFVYSAERDTHKTELDTGGINYFLGTGATGRGAYTNPCMLCGSFVG
jgi:hypothetical protein